MLYRLSEEVCQKEGIPFDILQPLILETAQKIKHTSPYLAQTGPAIRGDFETIKKHLMLLKDDEEKKEIYQLLTASIKTSMNYKEKLNHIKTFIFDVDGVLTDGKILLHPQETNEEYECKRWYGN